MEQLLGSFVFSILAATIASYVTVQLSLRRFYREKWWEKKLAAYSAVVESLHHMKKDLDATWDDLIMHRDQPKNEIEEQARRAKYRAARDEISKNADIGEFLLAPEVAESLRALERELESAKHAPTFDEMIDGSLFAVAKCLKEVKVLARVDLGLGPSRREWLGNWVARNFARKKNKEAKKTSWTPIPVTSPPSRPQS